MTVKVRPHPVYGPDHEKDHDNLWCAQCASAWDGSDWAEQQAQGLFDAELEARLARTQCTDCEAAEQARAKEAAQLRAAMIEAQNETKHYAAQAERLDALWVAEHGKLIEAQNEAKKHADHMDVCLEGVYRDERDHARRLLDIKDHEYAQVKADLIEAQNERDAAKRRLDFFESVGDPDWCGEHERRFSINAREGDDGVYDECQKCRAEQAEARLAAVVEALKLIESIYRQNVIQPGEPSSVLEAIQNALRAAGGS